MAGTPSRFRSALNGAELAQVAREVTFDVAPDAPQALSPHAYDARLALDAASAQPRWPGAPSADQTRRRLGRMAWYELLALLHDPDRSLEHELGLRRRRAPRTVTPDACTEALNIVAARRKARSLRPHEYAEEWELIVADDARAWRHGGRAAEALPTAAQIENVFATDDEPGWPRALAAAGLERPDPNGARPGMLAIEAAKLFLTDVGCLPWGHNALRRYANARRLRLQPSTGPMDPILAAVRDAQQAAGRWCPPHPPPRGIRPPIDAGTLDDAPHETRQAMPKGYWEDIDRLVDGVAEAYRLADELGRELTQPLHRRFARENHGRIPSPSTVNRNAKVLGRDAAWVREQAVRRRRQRR